MSTKTFQVNNSDSARVMLDKLNLYVATIKKEKYGKLLKLMNELFDKNNNTLRNFVKIDCNYFESKSISKIIKILETHKTYFKYDIDKIIKHSENQSNDESDKSDKSSDKKSDKLDKFNISKEIFSIISKLLKSIEYKLVKSTLGTKSFYSVAMC